MNSPPPPPIHITNSGLHLLITNFITNEILGIWDDQDLIESDINTFKEIVDGVGWDGVGGGEGASVSCLLRSRSRSS